MRSIALCLAAVVGLTACGEFSGAYSDYRDRAEKSELAAAATSDPGPEPTTWNGPFGLQAGISAAEIEAAGHKLVTLDEWRFAGTSVPTPHSEFRAYYFDLPPGTGLCAITGAGKEFQADAHGVAIRQRFDSLHAALEARYGAPTRKTDSVQRGSLFESPEYFTMALERGERSLSSLWELGESENGDPGIAMIALAAMAPKHMTGAVTIQYRLDNYADCEAEIAALKNRGL